MAQLVDPKCTNCGAPLDAPPGSGQVKCKYCGRTSDLSPRQPPPPGPGYQPPPAGAGFGGFQPPSSPMMPPPQLVPVPSPSAGAAKGAMIIVVLSLVGTLVAGAVVAFLALSSVDDAVSEHGATFVPGPGKGKGKMKGKVAGGGAAPAYTFADKPMLALVNGDEVLDVIGLIRSYSPQEHRIAALDGVTGKELWRTEPLAEAAHQSPAVRAVVGAWVISAGNDAAVQAYEVKTGRRAWQATLPEKPSWICAAGGVVGIVLSDRQLVGLDAATGAARPGPDKAQCQQVHSSHGEHSLGEHVVGWAEFDDIGLPDSAHHGIEGFNASYALVSDSTSTVFLLGAKSPGTPVPMVVAHDRTKVLWQVQVPGQSPLDASPAGPRDVASYRNGRLVVPYQLGNINAKLRVTCFDAATGSRLWDVEAPKTTFTPVNGLVTSDRYAYLGQWSALHAFALGDGKLAFSLSQ